MISPTQQEILDRLAELCRQSPDMRIGQLMATLGFLGEDQVERSLWDIEDTQLLEVIEKHRHDLQSRQPNVA